MGIIKNDTERAEELSSKIREIKPRLELDRFKFSGYLTSRNVSDDTTCNSSYNGGIEAIEMIKGELSKTAGFIDSINNALIIADINVKSMSMNNKAMP